MRLVGDTVLPTDIDNSDRTTGAFAETHTNASPSTSFSPEDPVLRPLAASFAWSHQSLLDNYNTVATPTFCSNPRDLLLANPSLFGHPQIWEHPVSFLDERIDSGTFMIQNRGLEQDITQTQLAHAHPHLPHIDLGSNQGPLVLPYHKQATIPVSIILHPQSVKGSQGVFKLTIRSSHPSDLLLGPTPNTDFTGPWLHLCRSGAQIRYLS